MVKILHNYGDDPNLGILGVYVKVVKPIYA